MPEMFNPEVSEAIGAKNQSLGNLRRRFDRYNAGDDNWAPAYKASEVAAIKAMAVEFDINLDNWEGNDA